jgi:uncharacterized protein with PQ loop repeat
MVILYSGAIAVVTTVFVVTCVLQLTNSASRRNITLVTVISFVTAFIAAYFFDLSGMLIRFMFTIATNIL